MKIARSQIIPGLEDELRRRFERYNRTHRPSKNRRIPADLMALVVSAAIQGVPIPVLCQITGVAPSTAQRWIKNSHRDEYKPRRLEVVRDTAVDDVDRSKRSEIHAPIQTIKATIKLPSGIMIELADSQALTSELLAVFNQLGGK